MSDPIDRYFDVAETTDLPPAAAALAASGISEALVAEDLAMVRQQYKSAISATGAKVDAVISLAIQMQEPDMIKAAAAYLTALSKISRDLIEIDLSCLNKAAKVVQVLAATGEGGQQEVTVTVTEATTAEVMRLFKMAKNSDVSDATAK